MSYFEYRFMLFDRPQAPWRATRREAVDDARRAGMADYDSRYRQTFITVPAWIAVRPTPPE